MQDNNGQDLGSSVPTWPWILVTIIPVIAVLVAINKRKRKPSPITATIPSTYTIDMVDIADDCDESSPCVDQLSVLPTPALPDQNSVGEGRTFAKSNYKLFYLRAKRASFQHRLLGAVHDMLGLYTARINPTLDQADVEKGVHEFMQKIQGDAFKNDEALEKDVDAAAEYLWTSGKRHAIVKGTELCSVLNAVIRDDVANEIKAAAPIFRSINTRRVYRTKTGLNTTYPSNGKTWRGGGFRKDFEPFFKRMKGKKYRVPGFLATSNKQSVAATFAFQADNNHPCVIWCIMFDPRGELQPKYRVQHLTFVSKSLIPGEGEYLFPPYSVFTLLSTKWSAELIQPHEFTVRAARDNQLEPEDLPLIPWY